MADTYGPFTAPYTFSSVPAGEYLVRGFIDSDTCVTGSTPCHGSDFIPWYTVTGEPNAGDLGGAAVDRHRHPRRASSPGPGGAGAPGRSGVLPAVTGVSVSFSEFSTHRVQ